MNRIRTMRAAGLTDDQIIRLLEVEDDERRAAYLERKRINQRNHRARYRMTGNNGNAVVDVADVSANPPPPAEAGTPIAQEESLSKTQSLKKKANRRNSREAFPDGWSCGADELAEATKQGLTRGQAEIEFERFRNHAIAGGRLCAGKRGWSAAWRNWLLSPYRKPNGTGPPASHPLVDTTPQWLKDKKAEVERKRKEAKDAQANNNKTADRNTANGGGADRTDQQAQLFSSGTTLHDDGSDRRRKDIPNDKAR